MTGMQTLKESVQPFRGVKCIKLSMPCGDDLKHWERIISSARIG